MKSGDWGREIPEISATELKAILDEGGAVALVDVREDFEREIADLPEVGQKRSPLAGLPQRISELDRERPLVLYCRSGSRSGLATAALHDLGFTNVRNLKGGLLAWKEEVDPSIRAY